MVAVVAFAAPALAATNPFMDVPQGHWSYDAVGLLASRGIVSGYPDGAFKGAQPATRYEMASVVARALVTVDAEKASKQDLELLKKLVMEFKDELDALGVKVDALDKRVAVLEENLGGWKITGTFRFDAKFADSDNGANWYTENGADNEFTKGRFRLFLTKQIDENTYFYAQYRTGSDSSGNNDGRGDLQSMRWSHLYLNTVLPWFGGMDLRVGRFGVDFEADYGLYTDNDALFGDFRTDGFMLTKKWNTFKATAIVGRNDNFSVEQDYAGLAEGSMMNYALDLNWQPNEAFFLGATGYWFDADSTSRRVIDADTGTMDIVEQAGGDVSIYGIYAGYSFTPAIQLKGIYYFQDLDDEVLAAMGRTGEEDSPQAWKAILDIDQDLLKFTSLWIEYAQQDNTFIGYNNRYSIGGGSGNFDYVGRNMDVADGDGTSEWWFVKAEQKWNDKWSSFVRFANVDYDTDWLDDATEWGVGVGYQFTPAIYFELAYDQVDHGDNNRGGYDGTESVIRFRTDVNF